VGEVSRDRDHRQTRDARRVLGDVERATAADADDGVVVAVSQRLDELERRAEAAALHGIDAGPRERRLDLGNDLLALAGPDDDGHLALRGDAAVVEEGAEARHGAARNVDAERRRDEAS
jgi:hypothetical protein